MKSTDLSHLCGGRIVTNSLYFFINFFISKFQYKAYLKLSLSPANEELKKIIFFSDLL